MDKIILEEEKEYLKGALFEINNQINELGSDLDVEESNINEFNRYIFKERGSMDSVEIRSNMLASSMEENAFMRRSTYLKKLYRIRNNPYFGRIDVLMEKLYKIYIGITYLTKDEEHIIYDWRSPIANLFYDSECGNCTYTAIDGDIDCVMTKKRQYKIENGNIINIFDNDLNVNDSVLQEVLSHDSSDKMKNIVNTIQKEQNNIIRNVINKHLIVQGIAGSGKTSVALHRIAFLLYKLPNLRSENVLIFSPNDIFSSYIANVLPELGEDNTKETTFSEFSKDYITEYKNIESFTDFVGRYYTKIEKNKELVKYKQSNEIIKVLEEYVENIEKNITFTDDLELYNIFYTKDMLNYMLKDRYSKLNIIERIDKITEYIYESNKGSKAKKNSINSNLYKLLNFKKDFKELYYNFYKSDIFIKNYGLLDDNTINDFIYKKELNYEDSLLFIYLKGLIQGFPYSNLIKEIVIDEAQDYSILQYIILKKIFKRASFTILGDINQTINPYYRYNSLEELKDILEDDTNYLSLNKTYRSSSEIIDYSNKILGLKYAVSFRRGNNKEVIEKISSDISNIVDDIKYLQNNYKKVCIITKDNVECDNLYEKLKDNFDITNMLNKKENYNPNLIIIPSYLAKGLEFDSVIVYNDPDNYYRESEKYLFYVAVTRAMHELIVYNN